MMYPLLLQPTLHTRVWGGRRLANLFDKALPTDEPYGESWEFFDTSVVVNGEFAGKTLGELLKSHGEALIGAFNNAAKGLPLLVKLLDATEWLSIQVHPNDAFARQLENQPRGKTEAWYILDAEPQSQLVIGVQPGTSREVVAQAIRENTLENLLVFAHVRKGDVLYIPAGTIHAIGPGLLIYEIQQASDITYRLYDWGRMGLDGKPRPLHIEKSITVSNMESLPVINHPEGEQVVEGEYFVTLRHTLNGTTLHLDTAGKVFHALTCIQGEVTASAGDTPVVFCKGQTVMIPAAAGHYTLSGNGQILNSMQRA